MLRLLLSVAALTMAASAWAQAPSVAIATDCRVTINATPSAWIIEGYDPFDGAPPEGAFGVTYTNASTSECRFTPMFQLDDPAFGLSRGTGDRIRFALVNLSETHDATPRFARALPNPTQPVVVLAPNESRTMLYRLAAAPDDIKDAGTFTQNVTLEAQDAQMRVVGGARIVLGLTVLPSARIGLSGAYTMQDGHAMVDLGNLREGNIPVPLQLRVNTTGPYNLSISSANAGRLRLGSTDWYVPYTLAIGGSSVRLSGTDTLSPVGNTGIRQDSLPIQIGVLDVSDRRAGTYSDVISISVSAQ